MSKSREQSRMVRTVVNGICASHLLADHQPDGNQRSLPVSRNCPHLPHESLERSIAYQKAFVLELVRDLFHLACDVRVILREVANQGQYPGCIFPTVFPGQPSRRFVTEELRKQQ